MASALQVNDMQVEQYVMAYEVEQDRLRAMLPQGFTSLRPVLRINAEIQDDQSAYLELNTPVAYQGNRGWLNISHWDHAFFSRAGKCVLFQTENLRIRFHGVGIEGGCPAEKDNCGCYFACDGDWYLRLPEAVTENKEFCDCEFCFNPGSHGISQGKTLPAFPTEPVVQYPKVSLTVENASAIPCVQVLGTYVVRFRRNT